MDAPGTGTPTVLGKPAETASARLFGRDFLLAGAVAFSFFMMTFMYFPTLPPYIKARGGSEADISFVIGMGGIMALIARPFVGWLVDGAGRRTMLIAGTILAAISSLAYSLAVTLPMIVAARLFGGAALSVVSTAATTLINDTVPLPRRGEANSYFGMAITIATGLGPPLGAFLVTASFVRPAEQVLGDVIPGEAAAGNYTVLFLTGVVLACLAALMAFLIHDGYRRKGIHDLPKVATMFRREAAITGSLNFTNSVPFAAVVSLLPLHAYEQGLSNPGLFFTVYSGMALLMRLVSGRASDRFGRAAVFLPGLMLVGTSMLVLSAATSPLPLLLAATLYGAGMGTAQPALTAYTADLAPMQARGAAMSTFSLGFDLALSFGAWGLGLVVTRWGMEAAFLTAGVTPFLGIAFFLIQTGLRR